MTFRARLAPALTVAATLFWFAAPLVASAQDVMELDLAFKNGQLQGHASEGRQEGRALQAQRHETRDALRHSGLKKARRPKTPGQQS
jgi:hypothetical protein